MIAKLERTLSTALEIIIQKLFIFLFYLKPVSRNFQMIKRWSDVVKQCGESSRTLLAAAFANIDDNAMAQDLVPDKDVEGSLLTLCILMDSSFWFETINLGWSIVYI